MIRALSPYLIPAFLFLLGFNLFIYGIDDPPVPYFDEINYVSAARQLIDTGINENWAHPVLGKLFISLGMTLAGDDSVGWRIMSAIFGSLIIVGMYYWGKILFKSTKAGIAVAALCAVNQMLYVQARIATLDIFMTLFIVFGFTLFTKGWLLPNSERRLQQRYYILSGLLFGLATASKWFGFIPLLGCAILAAFSHRRRPTKTSLLRAGIDFFVVPGAIYGFVLIVSSGLIHPHYAPAVNEGKKEVSQRYGLSEVIELQWKMLKAQMQYKNPRHPFQSQWYSWPLALRPSIYLKEAGAINGEEYKKAIIALPNPVVAWFGFLAVVYCLINAVKTKKPEAILISFAFFLCWVSWAIIPRGTTYHYYYFPAFLILSLAVVCVFRGRQWPNKYLVGFIALSVVSFIYFFPILSGLELDRPAFERRIWLPTWE